jgi:uncharacterized protein (DUF1330 family)
MRTVDSPETAPCPAPEQGVNMSAYCLWDVREIHDQDAMDEYVEQVTNTVEAHGGRYVVIGGPWQVVEGDWHPTYPVLIEFPSMQAATGWYASDEYRDLKALRMGASVSDAVFMDSAGAQAHLAGAAQEVTR